VLQQRIDKTETKEIVFFFFHKKSYTYILLNTCTFVFHMF